jgi:hypothetical protein
MKKTTLLLLLIMAGLPANSQYMQTKMMIAPTEYNFGVFKEEAGRQSFDFVVTNTGNQPLMIQNIVASCGCTTPEWTKSPIPPGGKGKVTAIYDPVNRPGAFNKTLTVYSNAVPQTIVLTIKGEVTPREKTVEELFTFPVSGVRFESNSFAFTSIKKTGEKSKSMPVINTSKTPVKVEFDGLPPHLTLKSTPETIQPGQKGSIDGTYDGTKNPGWGNVSDMVKVKINGVVQENVYLYVSANLVEDFSKLTSQELINAPVFKLASTTYDIGKMKPATTKEIEFKFTNEGKSDLVLRNIRATCGCTAIQQGTSQGNGIKPSESSSIKATFNSGGYKGKVTKTIYVYTNDPKNSEVVLMLTADIEQNETEK